MWGKLFFIANCIAVWGLLASRPTIRKMNVLGYDSALQGYSGAGTTWTNEMNFALNHTPGAG